ncbi:uncharacterized protein LOC120347307 isoform X2 [Styela clava]
MDQSLIEAVLENHSRSHTAINRLHDQLQSLEILQDSARRSFTAARVSGAELDRSSNNLLRSSSQILVPSPEVTSPVYGSKSASDLHDISPRRHFYKDVSPSKMRLSESQTSGFDVSAILSQLSPPKPFASENSNRLSFGSHNMSGDELLGILDKISVTGHQLQTELQDAKVREAHLIREVQNAKSKQNGFQKVSPWKSNEFGSTCAFCKTGKHDSTKMSSDDAAHIRAKCEKLQDAMLSLQDENMKLNRMLRLPSHSQENDSVLTSNSKLKQNDQELIKLQEKIDKLKKQLDESEKSLLKERDKVTSFEISQVCHQKRDAGINTSSEKLNYRENSEKQLENLCSRLQIKADTLQEQNSEYSMRIQRLEKCISLANESKMSDETYNIRIDDLHNALLGKDDQLKSLEAKLKSVNKQMEETENKTQKMKTKDICKRKEVLLLCEKYEQLKKNVKRLESDLRDSQKKLQESTTKAWALETSYQKNAEENEILRHQLQLHESLINSTRACQNGNGATNILKDYERLTEKYEALLDLRLREYDRVKVNTKTKKVMKQINVERRHHTDRKPDTRRSLIKDYDQHERVMTDSMWKRQQDFRRFYARDEISAPSRLRSQSADEIPINSCRSEPRKIHIQSNLKEDLPMRMEELSYPRHTSRGSYLPGDESGLRYSDGEKYLPKRDFNNNSNNNNHMLSHFDSKGRDRNMLTSTPVKMLESEQDRIERREKYDDKEGKSTFVVPTDRQIPLLSSRKNTIDNRTASKTRSRSLSPIRIDDKDFENKMEDFRPSSSRESQKSVSFNLNPAHRRTKSTNSVMDVGFVGSKLTSPRRENMLMKRKNISPVEVLEKVKSAYQEEYLHNMKGVDWIISPENSPPDLKQSSNLPGSYVKSASLSPSQKSSLMGATLCANRYKRSTESVKTLLEKNYGTNHYNGISGSKHETISEYVPTRKLSTSPKSILKKPKDSNASLSNSNRTPVVVREKFSHHKIDFDSTYDLSPPEMFRDLNRKDESVDSTQTVVNESVEIIDIKPKSMNQDGTLISSDSSFKSHESQVSGKREYYGNEVSEMIERKEEKIKRENKPENLMIPVQFLKDDDTDSLGQSSISSTRDHIGRFEFLQEMQSTLKNPAFSYQKQPFNDMPDSNDKINLDSDIGLSARQQEYADKLIKKYMKKSNS